MSSYKTSKERNMSRSTRWRRKYSQRLIKSIVQEENHGSDWCITPDIGKEWDEEVDSKTKSNCMTDVDESRQAITQEDDDPTDSDLCGPGIPEECDIQEEAEEWFNFEGKDIVSSQYEDTDDWFNSPEPDTGLEDTPLYPGAPITLCASLLLILNFTFCHGLTGEGLSDMLTLISLHCIKPNQCLTSLYKFRQFFKHLKNPLIIHKFCNSCSHTVTDNQDKCVACDTDLSKNTSFFIELPLDKQLKDFFGRPGFFTELQHRFTRKKMNERNVEDIYDGLLYRQYSSAEGFLNDKHNISLMWYTDGVPLFQSSKFSLWPVCFTINELPYNKRTTTENILLGGLWFGESKPCMLRFWEPITKSLNELRENGVEVSCDSSLSSFIVKVLLLCGTCDLPAKCTVLNMVQFNGKFGCPKCLQPGSSVSTGKGTVWTFPFDSRDIDGPKRRHVSTIQHAQEAHKSNQAVYGIKGPCWLSHVQNDVIRGTAIDFMHAGFLGIVRRMLRLWFDSTFSKEPFSISKFVNDADAKLLCIKPPNFISRVPRSISKHMKYWKASECRSWLYYYSVPVLQDIMDSEYIQHYMLLVEAAFTLNLSSISENQIDHCHKLLVQFVCMFCALYGDRHMSINVHQLLHLADTVRDMGPLWVYSCFSLEDFNGRLLKLFHGTQHPELQIVDAIATVAKLPYLNHDYINHPTIGTFLCKLSKRHTAITEEKLTGSVPSGQLTDEELLAIKSVYPLNQNICSYNVFSRLQKDGKTIPSKSCRLVSKRNSYTVECSLNGELIIGQIYYFFNRHFDVREEALEHLTNLSEDINYALLKELKVKSGFLPVNGYGCTCGHISQMKKKSGLIAVPVASIKQIMVAIEIGDNIFVTYCPNNCERD